jgi:hypothetical protein
MHQNRLNLVIRMMADRNRMRPQPGSYPRQKGIACAAGSFFRGQFMSAGQGWHIDGVNRSRQIPL